MLLRRIAAVLWAASTLTVAGCSTDWQTPPDRAAAYVTERFDAAEYAKHLVVLESDGGREKDDAFVRCQQPEERRADGLTPDERYFEERFVCVMRNAARWHRNRTGRAEGLRLVFYFNGGLNDKDDVHKTAAASWRLMLDEGYYPVFMVWPTGFWRSYGEEVATIRYGDRVTDGDGGAFYNVAGDVLGGLGAAPSTWANSAKSFADTHFGFGSPEYSLAIDRDWRVVPGQPVEAAHNLLYADDADVPEGNGAVGSVPGFAYSLAMSPARFVTTPFAAGFGETAWDNFVRRARTAVHAAEEFEFGPPPSTDAPDFAAWEQARREKVGHLARWPEGAGGFAQFFQLLQSCIDTQTIPPVAACPRDITEDDRAVMREASITLIGHSMGAIVVNGLLQGFPHLPYRDLVYMGAAATVADTVRSATPVLKEHDGCTRLHALMLHPMNEARERSFHALVPSGSLLHWVDSMYGHPRIFPDRTFGQWINVRRTKHLFPAEVQDRMLFRVFGRGGENAPFPVAHGEFNDVAEKGIRFWDPGFWGEDRVTFKPRPATCSWAAPGS